MLLLQTPEITGGFQAFSFFSRKKPEIFACLRTRLDKASVWADLKARRTGGIAAVVEFTVSRNDLTSLDCLFFLRGDPHAVDYWSFVQYCRTIGGDHNRAQTLWYDLVVGPVTGSWTRQTIIPDTDQISFHTPASVAVLDKNRKAQVL